MSAYDESTEDQDVEVALTEIRLGDRDGDNEKLGAFLAQMQKVAAENVRRKPDASLLGKLAEWTLGCIPAGWGVVTYLIKSGVSKFCGLIPQLVREQSLARAREELVPERKAKLRSEARALDSQANRTDAEADYIRAQARAIDSATADRERLSVLARRMDERGIVIAIGPPEEPMRILVTKVTDTNSVDDSD